MSKRRSLACGKARPRIEIGLTEKRTACAQCFEMHFTVAALSAVTVAWCLALRRVSPASSMPALKLESCSRPPPARHARHRKLPAGSGMRTAAIGVTPGFGRGHETLHIREPPGSIRYFTFGGIVQNRR